MPEDRRIYLDNAATSWPKPASVYDAVDRYQRECGAPAGRSSYQEASEVERGIADARQRTARLLGADDSRRVIFTYSGTDSLNLVLQGLLVDGDHVVTTVVEHNSVLRPISHAESSGRITATRVDCGADGVVQPQEIQQAIRAETRLICLTHASNVTGAIQPLGEVSRIAEEAGLLLLVDAAQTLGHLPLDVGRSRHVLVAAPGHKGLYAPLGSGVVYLPPGVEERLEPYRQGGTGTQSELDQQPETLPDRYESGNLNVPALLGLGEGLRFLEERGVEAVRQHLETLAQQLLDGLREITGVTVYGPPTAAQRTGVVSFNIEGYDPSELAAMLDSTSRIQTRAGFHCAPLMHRALGTVGLGGTLRISVGAFNTTDEIESVIRAVGEIACSAADFS